MKQDECRVKTGTAVPQCALLHPGQYVLQMVHVVVPVCGAHFTVLVCVSGAHLSAVHPSKSCLFTLLNRACAQANLCRICLLYTSDAADE